jgi:hypothetical protein
MRQKKKLMKKQSHNLLSAARRTQRFLEPPTITLTQLDACIADLYQKYQRIITTQSFQKHTTRTGPQDLAFVCFFVILLTVRHLGWRCSEIMRCRLDVHDGKYRLVVMEELKQRPDQRLILSLDAIQPAILQEALRSYAEVVYPFLQTVRDRTQETRFFFSFSRSGIGPFNNSMQFLQQFRFNVRRFLPLRDAHIPSFYQLRRLAKTASNPKEKLRIAAASALGDEVDTVKKTYPSSRKRKLSQ